MASAAVDLLVGKIAVLLENEVYLLAGVRDEVQDIQAELLTMKAFLEDADRKQPNNEVEKDWVGNVREVTYEIEDIIDEFMYHMNEQRTGNRLSRFLYSIVSTPKNLWVRHKIATQLQKIKKTIKEIPERSQRYRVDRSDGAISPAVFNWKQFQGESCLFVEEDELVGIEKDRQSLMELLMDGYPHQAVISVLGMGGSGKTTIVAKTCNNDAVTRYFNCYAFITVSQTYALDNIFRSLIKAFYQAAKEQVPADLEAMPLKDLLGKMVTYLSNKQYLVVLDDVWDIKLWNELRVALPHSPGSRIIITTRKEDIAAHGFGVRSHVHRVQPLVPDEAWKLFCMKAFYSRPDKLCPEELKPLAQMLVEKCGGLPLALVAMGGLMFSKKHVTDWSKICNSMNWHLANNAMLDSVKSILFLSFNDLPYYLKHCFLFCSIFPEDFSIRRKRLIRLWIGEGFIESKGNSPEDVADEYLMELTFRSMLQVVQRNSFGRPKACKMHDLMREIAITASKNERFCAFSEREEEIDCGRARRLSVQLPKVDEPVEIKSSSDLSKIRSLLVFYPVKFVKNPLLNTIPPELKLLKVLDLEDVPIDNLPDEVVKKLFNLRYLNIRRTLIKELPNSIGRLRNLHTLDIRDSKIEILPSQVEKLQNLRHLIMYRYNKHVTGDSFRYVFGGKAPANISKLKKLQVLSCVESEGDIVRQLGNMTQLTRIGVTNLKKEEGKDLCESIQKMKSLHYLFAMASDEEEVLDIHHLKSPPPQLKMVILVGKLERVPPWFCSLQSLSNLYLHWARLDQDLLPHIAALPCLSSLTLINAYVGQKLYFREGFAKLVQLKLYNFPELIEIEIERGAMPDISNIFLKNMMNLKRVPQGIEFLLKLETLRLESVSNELIRGISGQGEGREDRLKVEHIPDITYYYHSSNGKYYYQRLTRTQPQNLLAGPGPQPQNLLAGPGPRPQNLLAGPGPQPQNLLAGPGPRPRPQNLLAGLGPQPQNLLVKLNH